MGEERTKGTQKCGEEIKGKKRFIEIISEEYYVWKRQEEEKK